MPDGAAFPRLLSRHEAAAHIAIVDALRDASDNCVGYEQLCRRIQAPLETFAPRCNCGLVLVATRTIGMTRWSCSCGWKSVTA